MGELGGETRAEKPQEGDKMIIYPITDDTVETLDFRAGECQYALAHKFKSPSGNIYKTILMNPEELLILDRAIQEAKLKLIHRKGK